VSNETAHKVLSKAAYEQLVASVRAIVEGDAKPRRKVGRITLKNLPPTKVYGQKVHMHAYLPVEIYEGLKRYAEPGNERWESAVVRRASREWLAMKEENTRIWSRK